MKTALLSFHNAYNYGACLQAYALQYALSSQGIDCEYIDYRNLRRKEGYSMSARIRKALRAGDVKGVIRNTVGIPFAKARAVGFNRFYRQYLKTTPVVYENSRSAAELNDLYDNFIAGSDQIWNREHNGADGAFFLDFVSNPNRRISYASSFGMDHIPDDQKEWYAKLLGGIRHMSVREQSGRDLVHSLTGQNPQVVADPVFLPEREHWIRLAGKNRSRKPYTFLYLNDAAVSQEKLIRSLKIEKQEKHILSSRVKPSDFLKRDRKVTFSMAPEEFLSQIRYADLVVTTSFHCLAFAILFHRPFVAVLSGNRGRDERLLSLLDLADLRERIFTEHMAPDRIRIKPDYRQVDQKLAALKKESMRFLMNALNDTVDPCSSENVSECSGEGQDNG